MEKIESKTGKYINGAKKVGVIWSLWEGMFILEKKGGL